MTVSIVSVNTAIENWLSFINKVNLLIDLSTLYAVTVNATANGSYSVGNGFVTGIFGANTLVASTIRGGNVQGTSTLAIAANTISLGNSTVNTVANSVQINTSKVVVGNSTTGFTCNTTAIVLNGVTYTNLATQLTIANNYANIGSRGVLNFLAGNLTDITVTDDVANGQMSVTIAVNAAALIAGGIGGQNTYIQFNDSGAFGGNVNLTFNKTTRTLFVANVVNTSILSQPQIRRDSIFANSATTSAVVLDSFFLADFRAAKYLLSVKDNTANAYQATEILVTHNDGTATLTEYGVIYTNTDIAVFTASTNSTHLLLNYAGATNNTSVKGIREAIAV